MTQPLLDGQPVDPSVIDPAKHRYVGMWRPAEPPKMKEPGASQNWIRRCASCEATWMPFNWDRREKDQALFERSHWAKGCFDVPQYVSMEPVANSATGGRLRIPAREVKKGDVVWFARCSLDSKDLDDPFRVGLVEDVCMVERITFVAGGVPRILRPDELVEVERTNG